MRTTSVIEILSVSDAIASDLARFFRSPTFNPSWSVSGCIIVRILKMRVLDQSGMRRGLKSPARNTVDDPLSLSFSLSLSS